MLQPLLSYEVAETERDAARMDPPLRKAHPKSAPSSRPAYESNAPSYSSPYSWPLSSHAIFYAGHNSESKLHQALERTRHLFPTPMQRKRLTAEIIRKRNRITPLLEEIQCLREKRADEAKNFAALQSERANLVAKIASPCNKNKSLRHQVHSKIYLCRIIELNKTSYN